MNMLPRTVPSWPVAALFALWIVHLLLYVWLVPPWQHYDEPTHFEYAVLIRELGRVPALDEQLPALRRGIAASMLATGFYRASGQPIPPPDLSAATIEIGINERGHPPLYYLLAAAGTLPFRDLPIEAQLRAARCVSVLLAALLFVAANACLRLICGDGHTLRYAVLAALVLQPAFVDNMSAVNSDALANLVAVLLLLAALTLLRRPSWRTLALSVLVIALAWNVKRTLLIYSLLVPLGYLLAMPRPLRRSLIVGAASTVAGIGAIVLALPWPLADWQGAPTALVARAPLAVAGRNAFVLRTGEVLTQEVYPFRLRAVRGQRLTLVAHIRADMPRTDLRGPTLVIDGRPASVSATTLDTTWRTITITAVLPADVRSLAVRLEAAPSATVFYDVIALVAGSAPIEGPQEPDGAFEAGVVAPQAPANLLRNAGAERRVAPLPALVRQLTGRDIASATVAQALSSVFNPQWIAAVYPKQAWLLFIGAWGVFGWGQYAVSPGWFAPLLLLVVTSVVGSGLLLWQIARLPQGVMPGWRKQAWLLVVLAVIIGWGTALLRVHIQPFPGAMFWSFGRYTFVALLPSLLLFVAGFRAALPHALRGQGVAALLAFLGIFALIALTVLV